MRLPTVHDRMPENAGGKIQKAQLREMSARLAVS
jgi:hypothetical protein